MYTFDIRFAITGTDFSKPDVESAWFLEKFSHYLISLFDSRQIITKSTHCRIDGYSNLLFSVKLP